MANPGRHGSHANPDGPIPGQPVFSRPLGYALGQLNGTLRMLSALLTATPVEEMRWEPLGNCCILRFPAARLTAPAARPAPALNR